MPETALAEVAGLGCSKDGPGQSGLAGRGRTRVEQLLHLYVITTGGSWDAPFVSAYSFMQKRRRSWVPLPPRVGVTSGGKENLPCGCKEPDSNSLYEQQVL